MPRWTAGPAPWARECWAGRSGAPGDVCAVGGSHGAQPKLVTYRRPERASCRWRSRPWGRLSPPAVWHASLGRLLSPAPGSEVRGPAMQAPGLASCRLSGTVCQGHSDTASEPPGCWAVGTAPSLPQRRQPTHRCGLTTEAHAGMGGADVPFLRTEQWPFHLRPGPEAGWRPVASARCRPVRTRTLWAASWEGPGPRVLGGKAILGSEQTAPHPMPDRPVAASSRPSSTPRRPPVLRCPRSVRSARCPRPAETLPGWARCRRPAEKPDFQDTARGGGQAPEALISPHYPETAPTPLLGQKCGKIRAAVACVYDQSSPGPAWHQPPPPPRAGAQKREAWKNSPSEGGENYGTLGAAKLQPRPGGSSGRGRLAEGHQDRLCFGS